VKRWALVVAMLVVAAALGTVDASAQIRYKDSAGVWHWVETLDHVPPEYRPGATGSQAPPSKPVPPARPGRPATQPSEPASPPLSTIEQRRDQERRERSWGSAVEGCTVNAQGSARTEFKAYVSGPERVQVVGTTDQRFEFSKCMTEAGHPLR
jgi:hypothetical protein